MCNSSPIYKLFDTIAKWFILNFFMKNQNQLKRIIMITVLWHIMNQFRFGLHSNSNSNSLHVIYFIYIRLTTGGMVSQYGSNTNAFWKNDFCSVLNHLFTFFCASQLTQSKNASNNKKSWFTSKHSLLMCRVVCIRFCYSIATVSFCHTMISIHCHSLFCVLVCWFENFPWICCANIKTQKGSFSFIRVYFCKCQL